MGTLFSVSTKLKKLFLSDQDLVRCLLKYEIDEYKLRN